MDEREVIILRGQAEAAYAYAKTQDDIPEMSRWRGLALKYDKQLVEIRAQKRKERLDAWR